MKTTCPQCDTEFDVEAQRVGQVIPCPFCREDFVVDAEETESLTDFVDDAPAASSPKTKTCPMCGATNKFSAGECSACGESLTPFSLTTRGQVFRDGQRLVMTKGAELPYRCIKTNEAADNLLKRKLYWHPPWVYIILLVSPLIYIILALVLRQSADVKIPLCQRIRRRRLYAILSAWFCGLGMFAMIFVGIILTEPRYLGDAGLIVAFGGFFAGLIGLIVSLMFANIVSPTKIDKTHVWLKGVHPDYLDGLPDWEEG